MFETPTPQIDTRRQEVMREWQEKISGHLEFIIKQHQNNQEVIDVVKEKIKMVVEGLMPEGNTIMADLDACLGIKDKDELIKAIMKAIEPIRDAKINEPEKFEELQRQQFVESSNFNKINDLLSYGLDGPILHIHVAPNETTSTAKKLVLLRQGLKDLAKVVQADESIERVTGTSWIVAQHPQLLEKFGFTIEGEITDEERERFFGGETRDVHRAFILRDDFLKKYL